MGLLGRDEEEEEEERPLEAVGNIFGFDDSFSSRFFYLHFCRRFAIQLFFVLLLCVVDCDLCVFLSGSYLELSHRCEMGWERTEK